MSKRKHIARWVLIFLAVLTLLFTGFFVSLQTEWGKQQVESFLEEQLNAEITGLSGSLPFAPHIASFVLKDKLGPWLALEDITLQWNVNFFPFTWHIQLLKAERIQWQRMPQSEGEQSEFTFPQLPRMAIQTLSLPRIEIEEGVTGQRQLLAAESSLRTFADGGSPESRFHLRTLEGSQTDLNIATRGTADDMAVEAKLAEEAGGMVGMLAGLPDQALDIDLQTILSGSEMLRIEKAQLVANELDLNLSGEIRSPFTRPAFNLQGQVENRGNMPEILVRLAGNSITFQSEGTWSDNVLTIASLMAQGENTTLKGTDLSLSGKVLAGHLLFSIPDVKFVQSDLSGELLAQGELSGTLSSPEAKLNVTLNNEGQKLQLASNMRAKDRIFYLSDIKGETYGLAIAGALTYNMETSLAGGTLRVNATDLSGLNPFLATDFQGSGEAGIILAAANGKQHMKAEGKLKDGAYNGISASGITFNMRADDIIALKGIDLQAQATQIKSGETVIDTLTLTANENGKQTKFILNAESKATPMLKLHAEGQLQAALPDWTLKLNALQGNVNDAGIMLAAPVTIAQAGERITLTPLRLNIAEGNVRAEGFYSVPRADLRFAVTRLPLSLLTDGEYEGLLNGNIHVTGAAANPTATIDLHTSKLASGLHESGGLTLATTGTLGANRLKLRMALENTKGELYANIQMPAQFSLSPFQLTLPPDGALSGDLYSDAEIGPLLALFLPEGQTLTGLAQGKLALQGSLTSPFATGAVALTRGKYTNIATGTVLSNMDIRLEAKKNSLEIAHGNARAGNGHVTVSGNIALKDPYPLSLNTMFENATIIDSQEASGIANGTLHLTGKMISPLLAGKLTLGPMEIRLPEGSDVDVPEVEIRNPEILPKQVWQTEEKSGKIVFGPDHMRLDLGIEVPRRVYIRGRGLETEMRGAITIGGTMALPEIEGQLNTVRGIYTLLDRELEITEGKVTFRESIPPSPFILMMAETKTSELTAGVRIEGPLRSPELMLTSTPPRPQDEIMAHLLFGRDLRSITPFQGIQLAQAIQTLRGASGPGLDFLGRTRNLLGVDRLNIGETDSGDIGVGAGKYINDKIYIGVEGGADPEAGKVKTEIEVSPRFSVETETGGRSSGVRFNWKRDY